MTIIRKNGMFMLLKLITIIRKTLTILLGTLKDRLWQIQELKNMMVNMSLLISLIITRKKHTRKTLTLHDLIAHVIQHIPDKHFKLIRYYGLFANSLAVNSTFYWQSAITQNKQIDKTRNIATYSG